jgi:hypothetical protein
MMDHPAPALTLRDLTRSGLVLAGLLLLGVGLGDSIAGRTKITQYEELLRTTPVPAPADPTSLFPTASEVQERHDLARAKLAFYHLLLLAGQVLSAVGLILVAGGALRLMHAARNPGRDPTPAN